MKIFSAMVGFILLLRIGDAAELPKWQAEWKMTIEAAKKEGQVNVYIYR